MLAYIVRRLLLIIPTLFGIMVLNFVDRPGGAGRAGRADDRADSQGTAVDATARVTGGGGEHPAAAAGQQRQRPASSQLSRRAAASTPQFIKELEKQFGFDKPAARALRADDAATICASTSARASSATARWST